MIAHHVDNVSIIPCSYINQLIVNHVIPLNRWDNIFTKLNSSPFERRITIKLLSGNKLITCENDISQVGVFLLEPDIEKG